MKWLKFVIVVTVFGFVYADDSVDSEILEDDVRDMRELDREGWHAVQTFPEDQVDWIPHEPLEEQFPKRRRLRKRKRRPPVIDPPNDEDTVVERAPPSIRRRTRPQRLEQFREPWEDLSEEVPRKPNVRRRITPVYQPSEEIVVNDEEANINPLAVTVRVDDGIPNEEDEDSIQIFYGKTRNEDTQQPAGAPDLKSVLKQHGGGLSLSEILQQKNLSLAELLMGNQKAISALTENPNKANEATDNQPTDSETDTNKYKRLPPPIRQNINGNLEQEEGTVDSLTSKETLEAQRKRLALLRHKDNTLFPHSSFSSVTKLDVVTEPTTEKRIFVPSHPKYYTSLNFKPNFNLYNEPSTELPREEETTTIMPTTTLKIKQATNAITTLKSLPITNAKITKLKPKVNLQVEETEDENYPSPFNFPKPIQIDISEVRGFNDRRNGTNKDSNDHESVKKDEPLRMSIDLVDLMEKTTKKIELEDYVYKKTTPMDSDAVVTTKSPSTVKQTSVTAKEEIMEIMKDPISRERLSRILEIRNMTLQELVDQRERGSSQLHLADIFHNKTREPEPKEEPFVGHVNSDYFNSSPIFGRKHKSQPLEVENWSEHTTPAAESSTQHVVEIKKSTPRPKEPYSVTSFPTVKVGLNKNDKDNTQPFLWRELYPDLFSSGLENNYKEPEVLTDPYRDPEEDIHRLEDIDNALSFSSKETLNIVEENRQEDDALINIPSGVKSAIFVSLAIVGLSIVVFLTILLIFRWTQSQKTRLNYCSSLSSKIRAPIILQKRPANAIKSFMNETLGRRKNNYYKTNVQSMADDMWDDCRDRKPSF